TATPDHVVWTAAGSKVTLWEARQTNARLAVAGFEERPIRLPDDLFGDLQAQGLSGSERGLYGLQPDEPDLDRQYPQRQYQDLQVPPWSGLYRSARSGLAGTLLNDSAALFESALFVLQELRRSRYPGSFRECGGVCQLRAIGSPASGLSLRGYWPDQ